jgi:SAM-dependent methyltransferase
LYGDQYFAGFEYVDYVGQEAALRRSLRRHLQQMAKRCELEGSLFEVGCAYGFFLDEARGLFRSVQGIDIAENAVAYARDVLRTDAMVADFVSMDLAPQAFDVVCIWDTIEHVPEPERFAGKALEILRPGGQLFLTTGDIDSLVARLQGPRWRQIHPPTHLNYFSRKTLTRMLERVGFEVTALETAPYYHTLYNILATLRVRGGVTGRLAARSLEHLPKRLRDLGGWIDLRDIMFVVASRPGGRAR